MDSGTQQANIGRKKQAFSMFLEIADVADERRVWPAGNMLPSTFDLPGFGYVWRTSRRENEETPSIPMCHRRQLLSYGATMVGDNESVNPNSMSVEQAAKLLSTLARRQIPAEQIEDDVAMGAPTNADGTLNVLHYAAWLLQEAQRGG